MDNHYTYLCINIGAVIVPLLFSFYPTIRFDKAWRSFFFAVVSAAIPFLIWDNIFTQWGVWGFNSSYITGLYLKHLPLEEVLFFFCIPYSCVFTYYCFQKLLRCSLPAQMVQNISIVLCSCLMVCGTLYLHHWYTSVTFWALALMLIYTQFIAKRAWLGCFYCTFVVLLIPFFIVNGILTGTGIDSPIVWYNNAETIGFRLLTIPLEDVFYGMLLILLNITFFEYFSHKHSEVSFQRNAQKL